MYGRNLYVCHQTTENRVSGYGWILACQVFRCQSVSIYTSHLQLAQTTYTQTVPRYPSKSSHVSEAILGTHKVFWCYLQGSEEPHNVFRWDISFFVLLSSARSMLTLKIYYILTLCMHVFSGFRYCGVCN